MTLEEEILDIIKYCDNNSNICTNDKIVKILSNNYKWCDIQETLRELTKTGKINSKEIPVQVITTYTVKEEK